MLDFGLVLFGLLGLVIIIGVPYLLVSHARLKARVTALELRQTLAKPATAAAPDTADSAATPWGDAHADDQSTQVSKPEPQDLAARHVSDAAQSKGPDQKPATPPRPQPEPQQAPRAYVFKPATYDALSQWLRENWVLVAGAASLALAGVFMVQYGAENGLLTPFWRVMGAVGFGAALIFGGEVIRRRFGDETAGSMIYLPSALAGAGLIALFSGVLAARAMYDLIDPGSALAVLCLVSALAMVLGWVYGPFLSALGIIGASVTPFLVGGQSDAPWMFYYYFTLIALVGLAIDTLKRWAWVSVLALIATLSANWLLYLSGASELHFLVATLLIAGAAIVIPERRLWPRHSGSSVLDMRRVIAGKRLFPEFTTRLSAAVTLAATAAALLVALDAGKPEQVYLALASLVVLLIATLLWMRQAPALYDHALVPGLAILAVLVIEATSFGPLYREFLAGAQRAPETAAPATAWVLTAIGALGSVLAFLRMQQAEGTGATSDNTPVVWALAAAVFAPATLLVLEFLWQPGAIVGAYPWALASLAVAALMTLLAERTARGPDADQRALRIALFGIAALTLMALAFFLLLAKTALTLALAVMILLTVLIDRKFDLPALGLFAQVGVAVITYRLVIDPGFFWASGSSFVDQIWVPRAATTQVLLAYIGTLIPLAGAWYIARDTRPKTGIILESAIATIGAVFISVMILRLIATPGDSSHADLGILATVWAASMVNQLYRMQSSSRFSLLARAGLATAYGVAVLVLLAELFGDANPLTSHNALVVGPPILDSLAAAYLLLSAVFAVAGWKVTHFGREVQIAFAALASLLAAWYVTLEIRRLWRGPDLTVAGITDPELYSYTLALLASSAILLIIAFWRRSDILRKLAMAGVVVTIAKVFLVDMSGLSGLTRVFSFMGLGLALVGLAWLNRVMTAQWDKGMPAAAAEGESEA
ncbi:MAG: DUF2339 domain-containing protein [Rhodobacteraceae bacterium]|nr:DUF2339 domain-containing protein [Paracoccaceae bacterium]